MSVCAPADAQSYVLPHPGGPHRQKEESFPEISMRPKERPRTADDPADDVFNRFRTEFVGQGTADGIVQTKTARWVFLIINCLLLYQIRVCFFICSFVLRPFFSFFSASGRLSFRLSAAFGQKENPRPQGRGLFVKIYPPFSGRGLSSPAKPESRCRPDFHSRCVKLGIISLSFAFSAAFCGA